MKIFQVLVYYFTTPLSTTPFSGVLTEAYLESGRKATKLLDSIENRLL